MLKTIAIKNFKSFHDFKVNIKPITILLGKNSSGKSSFLQSLLLIKQTMESRDPDASLVPRGNYVDLGGYQDFIYKHDVNNDIIIALTFKSERYRLSPKYEFITVQFRYSYSAENNVTLLKEMKYFDKNDKLIFKGNAISDTSYDFSVKDIINGQKVEIIFYNIKIRKYRPWPWTRFRLISPQKTKISSPKRLKFSREERENLIEKNGGLIDRIIEMVVTEMENVAEKLIHIGPVREHPRRTYIPTGEVKRDVGLRGESAVEMLYSDKEGKPGRASESAKNVKRWLEKLDIAKDFRFPSLREYVFFFWLKHPVTKVESSMADHGFGLSQVLPLIVQGFYAPTGSILLLEQPEIHLHPRAQADLTEMLVEISKKRNVSIIAETHSEHIIERLQRLVAKDNSLLDRISVLLFRIGKKGARVTELKFSEEGKRVNWPQKFIDGFLDGGLIDAFKQEKILMKKHISNKDKVKGEKI